MSQHKTMMSQFGTWTNITSDYKQSTTPITFHKMCIVLLVFILIVHLTQIKILKNIISFIIILCQFQSYILCLKNKIITNF